MSKIGKPVLEWMTSSKLVTLKNMAMAKLNAVTKPMVTVPKMAMGMTLSACFTSSAKCEAESRHEKLQLGLIKPTRKAMPVLLQPVLLWKSTNTKRAEL